MERKIRYIALVVLLITLCTSAMGQGRRPYLCDREGAVLVYVRTDTEGEVRWKHTMRIGEVTPNDSGAVVKYSSYFESGKGKPVYGPEPVKLQATIHNGDLTMSVSGTVAEAMRGMLPKKTKVTALGGISTIPADMAPGDTLPDIDASVKTLGMTMKITVTDRKVLRYETISTPVGEFDCIVVRETKLEKGMGRNRHTIADTWYAPGIGMVRHDTHDTRMNLQSVEILTVLE